MAKYDNNFHKFIIVTKALSDETRVRAFLALKNGELCVCQITELLALAPSTVSKHMSILAQAGLVDRRKEGRWIYYRQAKTITQQYTRLVLNGLSNDPVIVQDAKRLKNIIKLDKEELCRKQCRS